MSRAKQRALDLMNETGVGLPQLAFPAVLVDVEKEIPDAGISITSAGIKTPVSKSAGIYGDYAPFAVSLGPISAPFPTMADAVAVFSDQRLLRFASMNGNVLWNVAEREFKRGVFLLDGFFFDSCTFEDCVFATRGEPFFCLGTSWEI